MFGLWLVLTYGVVGYVAFGFPVVDSIYMAVMALTTVGFDANLSAGGKAFTITLAVLGMGVFLTFVAAVTSLIAEGRLTERRERKRMQNKIDELSGHYIVCAYGRVGRSAAREFETEGVPFVVIESREEIAEELQRDGFFHLIGNPSSAAVLRLAGPERARGLVCAMDDDSANVFVTIIARSLNPKLFIVARASEPETPEVLYRAGADRVVSPYVSSGGHMGRLALRPSVRDYLEVGSETEKLRLDEILVDEQSPFVGRQLRELTGEAVPLLLRRHSGQAIPNPEASTRIMTGDMLVVFGKAAELAAVEGGD